MATRTAATKRLTVFYVTSLSAIAGLAIFGQLVIQRSLTQQELDIQVINTAQQQQMLIPQISRTVMNLGLTDDSRERQQRLDELKLLIDSATAWGSKLQTLMNNPSLSPDRRQYVERMIRQILPNHRQIVTTAELFLQAPATTGANPANRLPLPPQRSELRNRFNQPGTNAAPLIRQPSRSEPPTGRMPPPEDDVPVPPVGGLPMPTADNRPLPVDGIAQLRLLERGIMRDLDEITLHYNQKVAAEVQSLKKLEWGLLAVTLLVLLLEGVLVFRPAVQSIHTTLADLAKALQVSQEATRKLAKEQRKSEKLLLNILPRPIANRLKEKQQAIADGFAEVTVLFADIVGFTKLSATIPPQTLVALLNEIFSDFDQLAEKHGLEKIKTIGDAYMVVGGLPVPRADHAEAIVAMALDMQRAIAAFNRTQNQSLSIRIGINTGPVVAGVIGTKKFIYDLWGDTVNTASRMESHGIPGRIQMTASTYAQIQGKYPVEPQGKIAVKGKGDMETYLVVHQEGREC